jgi:hypothetical protein
VPETLVQIQRGLPLVFDAEVVCPAGEPIGETLQGSGCRCHVEDTSLLAATNPSSLIGYCLSSNYASCPTWRREKNRRVAMRLIDHLERL